MADMNTGILDTVGTILECAAAGYAFGEAAVFGVDPILAQDETLMTAVTVAAEQVSSIAVAVVTPCLTFTLVLLSLGCGLLLAAVVMKLWERVWLRPPWLVEVTTGASVVVGAVSAGVLAGLLPPGIYIAAHFILAAVVYARSNVNETIAALFVIFTCLFISVVIGSLGAIPVFCLMALTFLFGGFMEVDPQKPKLKYELQKLSFYCSLFSIKGFCIGLSASKASHGSKEEVLLMINSVVWVTFLSAGLIGAQVGAKTTVGLGQDMAGKITAGVAIISSVALTAILQWSSYLGPRSSVGGMLGAAAAAGFSLGSASVAGRRNLADLAVCGSVISGTIAAVQGGGLKLTQLTTSEFIAIILVVAGPFVKSTPRRPFHTGVIPPGDSLEGSQLIIGIGMEMVTAAAEPIALGTLAAAAMSTAALGRLGTLGILGAVVLCLSVTLSDTD